MATVRITNEIRYAVRRKIESLFDARIKKKYEELQHLDVAMQVFMRRIVPEEFAVAQKLNTDVKWVPEISSLTVHIEYTGIDGTEKKVTFTAPFERPIPAPQSFHGYGYGYSSGNAESIVHPSLPCYQPCVDVLLEHDRMVKERDTLRDSIAQLLGSCGTLRQVLEKWPTALDFMPDKVKTRHAEKVDPTKRGAKIINEVDDQAKMLLMKARMLSGV
jgi:hypothetical protein